MRFLVACNALRTPPTAIVIFLNKALPFELVVVIDTVG